MNFKIDLTGEIFGNWEVLRFSHKDTSGNCYWECKCKCGTIKPVTRGGLITGRSKSCGCLEKPLQKNLIGNKYGRLLVIDFAGKRGRMKNGKYNYYWICKCDCGKIVEKLGKNLKGKGVRSCGCLYKEFAEFHRKENHWHWTPDKTQEEREIQRATVENITWRKQVFKRDNYQCQLTGRKSGTNSRIEAHHLESWDIHVDLRYNVDNGITIDKEIHHLFHNIYGRGKNTSSQFNEFLADYYEGKFDKYLESKWSY